MLFADMPDEYPTCPICGDPIDYCLGHGGSDCDRCEFCGESMRDDLMCSEDVGEFYAPLGMPGVKRFGASYEVLITSAVGHASCGLERGWVMA